MNSEELHKLMDACMDAMDGEECRAVLVERVGIDLLNHVALHNANEYADKVRSKELTPLQAYDALAASLLDLYAMAGHTVSEEDQAWARSLVQQRTNRRLN